MHGAGRECIHLLPTPVPPIAPSPPAAPTPHQLPFTASGRASYGTPVPLSPPAVYTATAFGSTPTAGTLGGYRPPPGYVRGYGFIGSTHTTGGGYATAYNTGGYGGSMNQEPGKMQSITNAPVHHVRDGEHPDLTIMPPRTMVLCEVIGEPIMGLS